MGPQTLASDAVHAEKYRNEGESFREAMNRVSSALQDDQGHYGEFREILQDMRFMPAGRIQNAMGSTKNVTAYNCFVSGIIPDSFVGRDNPEQSSIMHRAEQAAQTMRMGGGIGYNFSTLRPKGDLIRGVQSTTDGPLAFMPIFNGVCGATSSAGNRRGAQMGVLRVDHPDIEAFIHVKQNATALTGFNLSIAITDEFMECLTSGRAFPLRFGGRVYREIDPAMLWETIMRSTYDWAEPGTLFIDTINRMNNLWYCEEITATNPCGEQPLPPFGACLLGSINLVKYLTEQGLDDRTGQRRWSLDLDRIHHDIPAIVRAMDNVVDRTTYPLPEQEAEAKSKRRMGIGVTGLANAIEALGHSYGSNDFIRLEGEILDDLNNAYYSASALLAAEKGAFPLYDEERYLSGQFIQTLRPETRELIKRSGIRNSHLSSIAPTGTISFCADNVSSGLEPVYSVEAKRIVKMRSGDQIVDVIDYGKAVLGVDPRTTEHVTPEEHVRALTTAQKYVDSAVSKTCNVPKDISWEAFKDVYLSAWEGGAKGCTTYRKGGKREGIFIEKPAADREETIEEVQACTFNPETGERSCEA